jgi:putative ABC transport system substrate-binding protein
MKLRMLGLVATLTVGLLATPPVAEAQQAGKVPRVGYLSPNPASVNLPNRTAFREGLRDHGYVEGETVAIEWRDAGGNVDRLRDLCRSTRMR